MPEDRRLTKLLSQPQWRSDLPPNVEAFVTGAQYERTANLQTTWIERRNTAVASLSVTFATILTVAIAGTQLNKSLALIAMLYPFVTIATTLTVCHAEDEIGDIGDLNVAVEEKALGPFAKTLGYDTRQAIERGKREHAPSFRKNPIFWLGWYLRPGRWVTMLGVTGDFVTFDLLSIAFIGILLYYKILQIDMNLYWGFAIVTVLLTIGKAIALKHYHHRAKIS